ncbi:MAG: prepilin-type N-terminal cleavage/methylation domain-containing protein [Desulfobulbaceae bacterium]|nr:prepilin-type N-terminal cleavage/methylation domain-containing protein [Desulfobulbaceae bacterium]
MKFKNMSNDRGFTLIELMVALAVGAIVTAVIYMAFTFQQQTWVTQDQLAAMQQGLRMSLRFIAKEVMIAGYDPTMSGNAGIILNTGDSNSTDNDSIEFTMDLGTDTSTAIGASDGDVDDPGEHIKYYLNGQGQLCRAEVHPTSPIICDVVAEDIDRLAFYYILEDGTIKEAITAGDEGLVRFVRVVIVARTEGIITQYTTQQNFVLIDQVDPTAGQFLRSVSYNDNRRRLLLSMNVQCRNQGI